MGKSILVFAALACAAVLGLISMRSEAPPSAEAPPRAAPAAKTPRPQPRAVVERVTGRVERRRSDGRWEAVSAGTRIVEHTVLRTGPDSSARLALGATVVVDIAESTTLSTAQITSELSRVVLDDGRVATRVQDSSGYRLRVDVRSSGTRAETADGDFAVMKRGAGPTAVGAERGEVSVSNSKGTVRVGAGEISVVQPGAAPSDPTRIPPSLYLKLAPLPRVTRSTDMQVQGTTVPGANVTVNGVTTPANESGRFSSRVALREGGNEIVVAVEDVLGRKQSRSAPKVVLRTAPTVSGEVQW